jgi:hypothetical protein
VTDVNRCEELVDRLYRETALYYREQRVQDIQSSINRSKSKGGKAISQLELAIDAWNELEPEWQKPLAAWLEEQTGKAKTVNLPDGDVRLPDAGNFFEATTIYFGKKPAISHVCASRSEAEFLFTVARAGLRGPVSLPTNEKQCEELIKLIEARLVIGQEKLEHLAQQRAGTDKLREQIIETLYRWFIQGKPE